MRTGMGGSVFDRVHLPSRDMGHFFRQDTHVFRVKDPLCFHDGMSGSIFRS